MPELPEVETTLRGIAPLLVGQTVEAAVLRTAKLRWPLDPQLDALLVGKALKDIRRRAKYLLFNFGDGCLLLHLGMSGSLRVLTRNTLPGKHDHFDLVFSGGQIMRLTDPRKFGAVLWIADPDQHRLLLNLGPEPLEDVFSGAYLHQRSRGRRLAVKPFIMSQQIVVGVGNIYASEALFRARIRPDRPAGGVGLKSYSRLAVVIKDVLREAIAAGGTTLQDFQQSDGRPGYFKQELQVYGRDGQACPECSGPIRSVRLGQRSTYFCTHCQR